MTSTFTTNKSLEKPANGDDVGTWDVPVNADWDAIDASLGGLTLLNVTSASGTVNLTATQYRPPIIGISGTLTADVTYTLPANVGGFWWINNSATGAHLVKWASATGSGTTVTLPQGETIAVICDGTNVALQSTSPSVPAGSNAQVQYNNSGAFAGSPNLTFSGTDLTIGGSLVVDVDIAMGGSFTTHVNVEGAAQTPEVAVAFSATSMVADCSLSNVFYTTFTANVAAAPTLPNANSGQTINWFITQDATGGRTMTWPASFKWANNAPGILSTAGNTVDLLVATYRSTTGNWYCSLVKNFQ